jgi:hypothetical protein
MTRFSLPVLIGFAYGAAVAVLMAGLVSIGRRTPGAFRLLWAIGSGAILLFLVAGLEPLIYIVPPPLGSELLTRTLVVRSAVLGALVAGCITVIRFWPYPDTRHHETKQAEQHILLDAVLSDILSSLGGALIAGGILHATLLPALPSQGPVWGGIALIVVVIVVMVGGFAVGHIVWLLFFARRQSYAEAMKLADKDHSILGIVTRATIRFLVRLAKRA